MSNDELVLELGQHHDSGAARRALLPRVVGGRLGGGLVGRGGAAHRGLHLAGGPCPGRRNLQSNIDEKQTKLDAALSSFGDIFFRLS